MNSIDQKEWKGSFVARRWSTAIQGYVAGSGTPIDLPDVNTLSRLPIVNYQAAIPPKDGRSSV